MERCNDVEVDCGLLDSVLNTVTKIELALLAFLPLPVVDDVPERVSSPPFRALIPLSVLQEAQELSRRPKRRKRRARQQRPVEVIYRRHVQFAS